MNFLVVGAGGFSKEVADLILILGHSIVAFHEIGEHSDVHPTVGSPIVNDIDGLAFDAVVVAIGDTAIRKHVFESMRPTMVFPTLVHPSAVVSPHASLGAGTVVMQHATVNADANVGENVIVNVSCCVSHDCMVASHTHLAPGVQMGGGSRTGEGCFCGASTVILPGVSVGDWARCGAGAVVVRSVRAGATVVGVPAREVGTVGQ